MESLEQPIKKIDYLAKGGGRYPAETLVGHTLNLLDELNILEDAHPEVLSKVDGSLLTLLELASKYHDLGKMNSSFQAKLADGRFRMLPNEVYHEYLSVALIPSTVLLAQGWTPDDLTLLYSVISNHHNRKLNVGTAEYRYAIEQLNSQIKHFNWNAVGLPEPVGAKRPSARYVKSPINLMRTSNYKDYTILKGLLNRLYYAASGHYSVEVDNHKIVSLAKKTILSNWKDKDASAGWNPMQEFLLAHGGENLAVIAPTGSGKTEGALNWLGDNKGFYVLPLRTSLNLMYRRLDSAMGDTDELGLLHASNYAFLAEETSDNGNIDEADDLVVSKQVMASANLSMPLTLTTADQLFKMVFRYRNYERVLATLSYSRVVVDELQVYDAGLLAYILRGLQMIKAVGGNYLIMTATLPPFVQDLLYERGLLEKGEPVHKFITDKYRHNIALKETAMEVDDIAKHYAVAQDKTLVIVNTVKSAQELAESLRESFGDDVHLMHSRFIRGDLSIKSKELMDFNSNTNVHGIWIATQMLESSADIDFDYLFTEFSELSGFFQRLGRVSRNRELSDDSSANVTCYVGDPDNAILPSGVSLPANNGKQVSVIAYELFNLGRSVLLKHGSGRLTEADKQNLLEVYSTANLKGTNYYQVIKQAFGMLSLRETGSVSKKQAQEYFRPVDNYDVIPKQVYDQHKDEIEEYGRKLQDKSNSYATRRRVLIKLSDYLVSIPNYMYHRLGSKGIEKLQLGGHQYLIAKAEYDNQVGFKLAK